MSDTPISWALLLLCIFSTLSFYRSCKESYHVSNYQTDWCFYVCWWRVITGVIILILKCATEDEFPGDRRCQSGTHCCSTLFSELPYMVMSAVTYSYMPDKVCRGLTTDNMLNAIMWNSLFHLLPLLYRLIISCKDEPDCHRVTLHLAAAIFVGAILFHRKIYC